MLRRGSWLHLVAVLACLPLAHNASPGRECARAAAPPARRRCLKPCLRASSCAPSRACVCDGACGLSCVKKNHVCRPLHEINRGSVRLTPGNVFGAMAVYSCDAGFFLLGESERRCQGDGEWSGAEPSCFENVMCGRPPDLANADHDAAAAQLTFPLGSQLVYTCREGFQQNGFNKIMCIGEGTWMLPVTRCSPNYCGHPGHMEHGNLTGKIFTYPAHVTYTCGTGYRLLGDHRRYCQADGTWSGVRPTCQEIRCRDLEAPEGGSMYGYSIFTLHSQVHFRCNSGYRLLGEKTRKCLKTGTWSGTDVTCQQILCGYPGAVAHGYYREGPYYVGDTVIFYCNGTAEFGPGQAANALCLASGKWSHPPPKCYDKCRVPIIPHGAGRSEAGVTAGGLVSHGRTVNFRCDENYALSVTKPVTCNNGSWTANPACEPLSCRARPARIRHGVARFYGMRHGSRAKYTCNGGYSLHGDAIVTCSFGKWRGERPKCMEAHCPYPGRLTNGTVYLVGVVGMFEYRWYVRGVGQGERIVYTCDRDHVVHGTRGATCVGGRWSPPGKPTCVDKKHKEPPSFVEAEARRKK